jgi:hypothetical protein
MRAAMGAPVEAIKRYITAGVHGVFLDAAWDPNLKTWVTSGPAIARFRAALTAKKRDAKKSVGNGKGPKPNGKNTANNGDCRDDP